MYISLIRSVLMFLLLLFIVRLMGKRQLGEMQPFELVITLLIADLACSPLADTTLPITNGIVPIIVLCALHYLISFIARKSIKMRNIISGKPQIAINPDGIDYKTLQKLNININDLIEAIRSNDVFYLEDIMYGIFETNGSFFALKNEPPQFERSLPVIAVMDGKIMKENIKILNINEDIISRIINENNIKNLKNVIIMTLDDKGNMYLQERGKKFITAQNVNIMQQPVASLIPEAAQ